MESEEVQRLIRHIVASGEKDPVAIARDRQAAVSGNLFLMARALNGAGRTRADGRPWTAHVLRQAMEKAAV